MFSPAASLLLNLLDDSDYSPYGHGGYGYLNPPHAHLSIIRPKRQESCSSGAVAAKSDPSTYQVMLNVKQFSPNEIEVKIVDNFVVIHGKHEEHADEHGFVSREFTRRYQLPDDVEPQTVKSSLSQDGVLTIKAPRRLPEPVKNERVVPIILQKSVLQEQRAADRAQERAEQEMEVQQEEKK
ncbi:protein lethal(2)essential for life-like [Uloborus diversus]|uniref:protein lethal(2)essential for life-like n=1 Tax=Uloborus diversus TaxID=327109 RepID=UPI00240938B7|nr:protein lethal(2)essential for life-like [Uloborus diversus]